MSIVWEDPPPAPDREVPLTRWREVAAMLRSHPKRWAIVQTCVTDNYATTLASRIRTGQKLAGFRRGHFEAKVRTVDGRHRVYARYVGEEGGAS